jgi:hypothetical protein
MVPIGCALYGIAPGAEISSAGTIFAVVGRVLAVTPGQTGMFPGQAIDLYFSAFIIMSLRPGARGIF